MSPPSHSLPPLAAPRAATLRTIATTSARPAIQIARDLALLELDPHATLRFYCWEPIGLTLGRFQDASRFAVEGRPHELVRRPTGGGAIWHEHELTYSLSLPDDESRSSAQWQDLAHGAIARALRALGFESAVLRDGPVHEGPRASGWCFAEPRRGDLVGPDGAKLCGSALRRTRRPRQRLLMHGSLMLRSPSAGPRCAALADQSPPPPLATLETAIASEFGRSLAMHLVAGALAAEEEQRAMELVDAVCIHQRAP